MEMTLQYNPWILALVIVWVLPWKIYSVWLAARRGDKKWFVVLLILNTCSILEIIYIFYIAKKSWADIKALVKRLFTRNQK